MWLYNDIEKIGCIQYYKSNALIKNGIYYYLNKNYVNLEIIIENNVQKIIAFL